MEEITIFVHRPGVLEPIEVTVSAAITVDDLLAHSAVVDVVAKLRADSREVVVMLEEEVGVLPPLEPIGHHGARHGNRVHLGHHHKVDVEIFFTHLTAHHDLPLGTRIRRVKEWAANHFGLAENDAIEHVLNLHGTQEAPSPGIPLASLLHHHHYKLAFDLVPAKRVEG